MHRKRRPLEVELKSNEVIPSDPILNLITLCLGTGDLCFPMFATVGFMLRPLLPVLPRFPPGATQGSLTDRCCIAAKKFFFRLNFDPSLSQSSFGAFSQATGSVPVAAWSGIRAAAAWPQAKAILLCYWSDTSVILV